MRCIGTRIVLATTVAAMALLGQADPAFAKILPVTSIEVTTVHPSVGHRVDVLVRFAPSFTLGDAEWENHEVSVMPTSKADASGWPLDHGDRGTPVRLRRIGKGVFRGTFVVRRPGDYFVFAWSSVYAREDRLHGVVTKGHYAPPVRLRIDGDASIAAQRVARTAAHKSSATSLALWVAASVFAIGIVARRAIRRLDAAVRKARRRRAAVRLAATTLLGAAIVLPAYWVSHSEPTQKLHVGGTSRVTTSRPRPPIEFRNATHRFSIEIPVGWFRSEQPLEPWLLSPHEILSIATVPVSPSTLPGNQAACPSEIPKVAVDAIGRDGAYLGIYEWIRGEGLYGTEPRPDHAALLHWVRECPLPNGITAFGATFTDGDRDFTVHMVLGADAAALRAEIYAALDSFRPDAQSAATTAPAASRP